MTYIVIHSPGSDGEVLRGFRNAVNSVEGVEEIIALNGYCMVVKTDIPPEELSKKILEGRGIGIAIFAMTHPFHISFPGPTSLQVVGIRERLLLEVIADLQAKLLRAGF
jgi:hypothetical protein